MVIVRWTYYVLTNRIVFGVPFAVSDSEIFDMQRKNPELENIEIQTIRDGAPDRRCIALH